MDANAERVIARLYAVETPMPKAKLELYDYAQALDARTGGRFRAGPDGSGFGHLHTQTSPPAATVR